jgi:hypothetical protein
MKNLFAIDYYNWCSAVSLLYLIKLIIDGLIVNYKICDYRYIQQLRRGGEASDKHDKSASRS